MENMLPGNSFPQICVVSVNKCVENIQMPQEYLSSTNESNFASYYLVICIEGTEKRMTSFGLSPALADAGRLPRKQVRGRMLSEDQPRASGAFPARILEGEKQKFPGLMDKTLPENSISASFLSTSLQEKCAHYKSAEGPCHTVTRHLRVRK